MDSQGPNMSREWSLDIGTKLLAIVREEREKTMAGQQIPVGAEVYTPKGKMGKVLSALDRRLDLPMANGEMSQRDWQYRVSVSGVAGPSWFAEEELTYRRLADGTPVHEWLESQS